MFRSAPGNGSPSPTFYRRSSRRINREVLSPNSIEFKEIGAVDQMDLDLMTFSSELPDS